MEAFDVSNKVSLFPERNELQFIMSKYMVLKLVDRMIEVSDPDKLSRAVAKAIYAVQSGKRAKIERAYKELSPFITVDVLADLAVRLDSMTQKVDDEVLFNAAKLPIPPRSREILAAAKEGNVAEIRKIIGSDSLEKLFASLFVLTASLKDAEIRLMSEDALPNSRSSN